eukprot:6174073-Pleurochrysis_carterae.AAC.4
MSPRRNVTKLTLRHSCVFLAARGERAPPDADTRGAGCASFMHGCVYLINSLRPRLRANETLLDFLCDGV